MTVLEGCLPPSFLSRPDLVQRASQIKHIALLPPRVDVFEIGAGGVREKMDDWSARGTENISQGIATELEQRSSLRFTRMDSAGLPDPIKAELEDTRLLFDAVTASVIPLVYGVPATRIQDKVTNFDYSLGTETAKLNLPAADAFLLVNAVDHISTPGRQAVQLTTMLAAAALGVVVIPQRGVTMMSMALIDARTGDILWYKSVRSEGGHDLRESASAAAFVQAALGDFPIR